MEYFKLNCGDKIPALGLGVYQIEDEAACRATVREGISAGYRLLDTAAAYLNERAVGQAVKESGIDRGQLFITSKLWVQDMSYEKAKAAIDRSLKNLGCDYLDLYLIHQPMGDYFGAYRAMEEAREAGKIKALGVSNFYPHILADFCETVDLIPAVNQVELHPLFAQGAAVDLMKEYGVLPQAWAPLGEGRYGLLSHPAITDIACRCGKTAAQVILRWNIQRGVCVIPKTTRPERLKENIDVFDFRLSPEDMAEINSLDRGKSLICDHTDPQFVRAMHRQKVHD